MIDPFQTKGGRGRSNMQTLVLPTSAPVNPLLPVSTDCFRPVLETSWMAAFGSPSGQNSRQGVSENGVQVMRSPSGSSRILQLRALSKLGDTAAGCAPSGLSNACDA